MLLQLRKDDFDNKTLFKKRQDFLNWLWKQRRREGLYNEEKKREKKVLKKELTVTKSSDLSFTNDDPDLAVNKLKKKPRPSLANSNFAKMHDQFNNVTNQKLIRKGK